MELKQFLTCIGINEKKLTEKSVLLVFNECSFDEKYGLINHLQSKIHSLEPSDYRKKLEKVFNLISDKFKTNITV